MRREGRINCGSIRKTPAGSLSFAAPAARVAAPLLLGVHLGCLLEPDASASRASAPCIRRPRAQSWAAGSEVRLGEPLLCAGYATSLRRHPDTAISSGQKAFSNCLRAGCPPLHNQAGKLLCNTGNHDAASQGVW